MKLDLHALFVPLLFVALIGCGPDEPVEPEPEPPATTGTLRLRIVPTWEGQPFVMNSEHINVSGYRVKVEVVKFYLGEVKLVSGSSSTVVKDVEYFDMHNGAVTKNWNVGAGTWSGLSAGLGVPASMNNVDPIVYPSGHPLNLALGTHWSWSDGYRFLQFDGRYDTDGGSTGILLSPFSIHSGMNELYEEFDLDLGGDVSITVGDTTSITLRLAIDRFFYSELDTVDLATENQAHLVNPALSMELNNNALRSFSVE